jgi:hypothetical protein
VTSAAARRWLRCSLVVAALVMTSACVASDFGAPSPTSEPATAVSVAVPAYPLKVSLNQRFLVDQNDQPVFWSGDTAWSLIAQGTREEVDEYLNDRQRKGFNVILVNLIEAKFGTNAPSNIYGDAPFVQQPFATPNEAYFAQADYVIRGAAQRGIAVLLDPLYLGYNCGDEGWCEEVRAASTDVLQSWGKYVGSRYESFDNIVWLIGGDVDPAAAGVQDQVSAFVTGLVGADTCHLITAHNVPGMMAVAPWTGADWLTVNNTYTALASTYQSGQTAYAYSPTKPFFHIEGYYENEHGITDQQLRAQAYWTLLSGGFGYLFGNCPIWHFGSAPGWCGKKVDWKGQLNRSGSIGSVHVAGLFRAHAWEKLVPDWDHSVVTVGYGAWGELNYVTAARASDGSLVMAYLPSVRAITVDLARLSGTVTGRWYDPTNGAYRDIPGSPFENTGSQVFKPAGRNSSGAGDWVLVLEVGQTPLPVKAWCVSLRAAWSRS